MARPAKHPLHPFLLIEESVKVWVRDDTAPGATFQEGSGYQPLLPRAVGFLSDPLAFPLYLVRTVEGEDVPAEAQIWDEMLIARLLRGGDFGVQSGDSCPSNRYCRELLDFHFERIPSSKQYEFAAYLRQLLEKTQANLQAQLRDSLGSDIANEMADLYQTYEEYLQYGLARAEKKRSEARMRFLNKKNVSGRDSNYTGKVRTLAHLSLIKSGLEPSLSPQTELHVVQEYIAQATGLSLPTVKRYIRASSERDHEYYIYATENLESVLSYIGFIRPEVNLARVVIPPKWQGAAGEEKKTKSF